MGDVRDPRDIRDVRDPRDVRDVRDARDPRDVGRGDPREMREMRGPGGMGVVGGGAGRSRMEDALDLIRQEFEALSGEMMMMRSQRDEFEAKSESFLLFSLISIIVTAPDG